MSTFFEETKSCVICNKSSEQMQIGSTNSFGPCDLDLRPPEMQRSTMRHWIEVCPHCGYVASNISAELDESKAKKKGFGKLFAQKNNNNLNFLEWLLSDEFKGCNGIEFKSELAKNFYQYHLILLKHNKNEDAFFALRNAAWSCDDSEDKDNAILCRVKALELLKDIIDANENMELVRADMLRRSGQFETVISEFSNKHYSEELLNKIVAFQILKAKDKDDACYTVEDVQNI